MPDLRAIGLVALLCALAFALPRAPFVSRHRQQILHERATVSLASYPEQYYAQELDHFDVQERRTWKQRFFINNSSFDASQGGPIFFQIGGEGAISGGYVGGSNLVYLQWAKQVGAIVVVLEHRFYGKSHPFPTLATENLRYLSSEQALADAAKFIAHVRSQYPTAGPVITFGGSYPGALAAWFRLKYPHLTVGSIASSAPVQAVLDMVTYLDVVDESLEDVVGKVCVDNVQAATNQLQSLLQTSSGRQYVAKLFNTCTIPATAHDISNFISDAMGNFMGTVQYDGQITGAPTIQTLCNIMDDDSVGTPLERYAKVNSLFSGDNCVDVKYSDMIQQIRNITEFGETGVGIRQWTYQTCAEFGYFQSTDSSNQPFGNLVPISFYEEICRDVFGFHFNPRINETNTHYGGKSPVGSNVCFVNGSLDPWHSLSIIETTDPNFTAIYIKGTSHCEDMSAPGPDAPPTLAKAQQVIGEIVLNWSKQQ